MPVEDKIRSVGNKSVIYPWMRRYVVIGPYNRHVRKDIAESALTRLFGIAAAGASIAASRASATAARRRSKQRDEPTG